MVRRPLMTRRLFAASICSRRSFTVPVTADTSTNSARVVWAMMRASVVLPVPAGPKRMTELNVSCSMARRSHVPGPTASVCPQYSSSVLGRTRTARGALALTRRSSFAVNNVCMCLVFLGRITGLLENVTNH